jgi:glycosyltransferase involved in cell wall biosynthesis
MGVGQLGRMAAAAVEAAAIPVSHHVTSETTSRQSHHFESRDGDEFNVNLVCVNADELPRFANQVGREFFDAHYTIGYWAWELPVFPSRFASAFDYVDEIWGCSSFTAHAISSATSKPVFAFAPPILPPTTAPPFDRAVLGIPDGPMFLFCFDMLSVMERKNPIGLVDAFTRAFAPGEGPVLVIKVMNGERSISELERLRVHASGRPDVVVIDRYLDYADTTALMAACDCYASLHRSEGFGLTMAEAMALGKPVVATGFSGNMDFMTDRTAFLVPWSEAEVPAGCDPYPPGAPWAQPDIDGAAELLKYVVEHPDSAAAVATRARDAILTEHSASAKAPFVQHRFAEAQRVLRVRRRKQRVRAVVPRQLLTLRRNTRRVPHVAGQPGSSSSDDPVVVQYKPGDVRTTWPDAVLDRLNKPSVLEPVDPDAGRTS